MRPIFITLFILSQSVWANFTQSQVEKLKSRTQFSYEDLAHENLGCPENSICSKEMGLKLKNWDHFIESLKPSSSRHREIENFRAKHGIPVSFLAKKSSKLGIDPILFSSRCAQHNPKDDKENTIYKAMQFFRNDPSSKTVMLDNAWLGTGKEEVLYRLPYEELPIMVKDNNLVVVLEHQGHFYHLAISPKGQWKVVSPSKAELTKARQVLENAQCSDEVKDPGPNHLNTFCKNIWNVNFKKAQTVRLSWACH